MTDTADLYRRLSGRFTDLVEAVPPDRWDAPSPCADWSARDVLAHIVDSEQDFLARFDLAPESQDGPPAERWPLVREAMQAALDDPAVAGQTYDSAFGPTTLEQTADGFYNLDLIVHGWDVARATGMKDFEEMPPDQLETRFAAVRAMGDTIRTPGAFGPEVEIDDDADLQSRFLAFLGRRP